MTSHRRVTDDCNAWFFCEDDRGCEDWQTQLLLEESQCVLMSASTGPQPEPKRSDGSRPFSFSSFQAGYRKGDLLSSTPPARSMLEHVPSGAKCL